MVIAMLTGKDKIDANQQESVEISNDDDVVLVDSGFIQDEFEVAGILLNLRPLMDMAYFPFHPCWGRKRKRSIPALPYLLPRTVAPPPPKAASTSPDTPLNFPRSESSDDGKSKRRHHHHRHHHHRHSTSAKKITTTTTAVKKARDELEELEHGGKKLKQDLTEKIEKTKLQLENLKAENSELLAKKQKLIQSVDDKGLNESPMTECTQQNSHPHPAVAVAAVGNDQVHAGPSQFHHQPPSSHHPLRLIITNRAVQIEPTYHLLVAPQLDLNKPPPLSTADIDFEMMMRKQRERAARQNRILINKNKKLARVR